MRGSGGFFGQGGLATAAIAVVAVVGVVGLFWNEDLRGELQASRTYELQGSGAAHNARGEVVGVRDGKAVLIAKNLPYALEGKATGPGLCVAVSLEPAGTFEPHDGVAAMPIERSLYGADAVAVTVEPSGSYPAPTDEPRLTVTL